MLEASDTLTGAIAKLAAGNVGTASVLGQIIDDPFAGLMILWTLRGLACGASKSGCCIGMCMAWTWTDSSSM